ncbi:MAG: hypothetical protein D6814_15950 [Calditrichaeota bacterium]|nr:MAG: hypothetical protein D6814_15950 [Calditrichota bacterium]
MWYKKKVLWILMIAQFFMVETIQAQARPILQEIKKSLTCTCGCNMTVEACQGAMACDSADKLTAEAQQWIDQGLSTKQILSAFVNRYGETILSAPTKKGFNLTAWITPFLLIILAGFTIMKIVQKWAQRPGRPDKYQHTGPRPPASTQYDKMLNDILKKLD